MSTESKFSSEETGLEEKTDRLEVTSSNKVPEIISQYYLKAVKRLKSVWKKIKSR